MRQQDIRTSLGQTVASLHYRVEGYLYGKDIDTGRCGALRWNGVRRRGSRCSEELCHQHPAFALQSDNARSHAEKINICISQQPANAIPFLEGELHIVNGDHSSCIVQDLANDGGADECRCDTDEEKQRRHRSLDIDRSLMALSQERMTHRSRGNECEEEDPG